MTVGLPFAPLLSRRMSSEGQLTADGLMPERYDENSKVAFRERRRATLRFEPDAIVMPNGERRERWPGVQDTASQFVQLTYLFTTRPERLTPGSTIDVPLALPRNVSHWIYDVRDLDTLFGRATLRVPRSIVHPVGPVRGSTRWLQPQLRPCWF